MRFQDRAAWVVGVVLVQVTFGLTLLAAVNGVAFDIDRVTTVAVWALLGAFLHTKGSEEIEGWLASTDALIAMKHFTIFQAVASILIAYYAFIH